MKTLKEYANEGLLAGQDATLSISNAWEVLCPLPTTKDFVKYKDNFGNTVLSVDWNCKDFIKRYIYDFHTDIYHRGHVSSDEVFGLRVSISSNNEVRVFLIANYGKTSFIRIMIIPGIGTKVPNKGTAGKKMIIQFLKNISTSENAMKNLIKHANSSFYRYRWDLPNHIRQSGAVPLDSIIFN